VLQFPKLQRAGLWGLVWGCSLCAVLHIAGIGVSEVESSRHDILLEQLRTSVFGENANVVGANYATAAVILFGLAISKSIKAGRLLLIFPLIALVGFGMAKTGSRTAMLLVVMGILVLLFQSESLSAWSRRCVTVILIGAVLTGIVWQVPTVVGRF